MKKAGSLNSRFESITLEIFEQIDVEQLFFIEGGQSTTATYTGIYSTGSCNCLDISDLD